jgi:uncharacterized protein (TIGR02266 family)
VSDDEKRRDPRETITLLVEYEGADDLVSDFTENLSEGGTFVSTSRELAIGTRVRLVLSFPGLLERLAVAGIVRWTRTRGEEGDAGAGIEFDAGTTGGLPEVIERIRSGHPGTVTRPVRLLVVEDNRHIAKLIEQGLLGSMRRDPTGLKFAFRDAEDGRAAVEILRKESIDALVIDIYLPILDGSKVIAAARTELGLTKLPIIAFSAGGEAARDAALSAGADIFLDKPMRLRQVLETLQRLLGR